MHVVAHLAARATRAVIPEDVLLRIPGCEQGAPPDAVRRLPGGRGCNLVVRVDTARGRFVWRRRQAPIDRPGSTARTELAAQQAAAGAGLAPQVLAAAPDASWLLMVFEPQPHWTEAELCEPARLERLAGQLRVLHALPVPVQVAPVDARQIAQGQLALLRSPDGRAAGADLVRQIDRLHDELRGFAVAPVLCHGDLQASNLLGPRPVLVDWEYAQVADPAYDLACLLTYYPGLASRADWIMGSAGLDGAGFRARLALQQRQFALLTRLWELVEGIELDK